MTKGQFVCGVASHVIFWVFGLGFAGVMLCM